MKTNMNAVRWGWALGAGIVTKILMILSAFVFVAIYSHVIHPGETAEYYQQFAQDTVVYESILFGIPFFFATFWWIGRKLDGAVAPTMIAAWVVYVLLDIPFHMMGADFSSMIELLFVAHGSKLISGYLGGALATRQVRRD